MTLPDGLGPGPGRDYRRPVWSRLLPALVLLAAAGCHHAQPVSKINFYLRSPADLTALGEVALVELACQGDTGQVGAGMSDALAEALTRKRLFRLGLVRRDDPRLERLSVAPHGGRTLKELSAIRQALGCEAVLLGEVSGFQPYPRMQASLSLRLLDLRDGRVLWGLDHTWDTEDKDMEGRIRQYFDQRIGSGHEPAGWQLVRMSPNAFEKFIAHEVASTLPERQTANTEHRTRNVEAQK